MADGTTKTYVVSSDELHRLASRVLHDGEGNVFESLPSLMRQIIERKNWKTFGHKTFAEYVLDDRSTGLGVNSNQRLWMLRCALDVHGDHVGQWAELESKIEAMVRDYARENKMKVSSKGPFDGNSLEELAQNGANLPQITYLPSRSRGFDGDIVRLHRRSPELYKAVVSGKMSLLEARKAAGFRVDHASHLMKAKSAIRKMNPEDRADLLAWMTAEGLLP